MGCLFSKRPDEHSLLETAASSPDADAPRSSQLQPEPEPAPPAAADPLKPMGKAGFATITSDIQQQLGSWKAPLNPSESGEEGTRYVTNENAPEMVLGATLGKGNYGVVHRAEWRGRAIAVKKVLLPSNLRPEQRRQLVEDFKCEVDICCRLTHPRLVAFLGYTTTPDLCIVQELMPQGSLYDTFQRGAPSPCAPAALRSPRAHRQPPPSWAAPS